jgi:hypothetical protein
VGPLDERTRERRDEQDERQAAQGEEQPVPDLLPLARAHLDALEEHERRKLHGLLPLAMHEVHEHRHGEGGEPGEKERSEETHQRTRTSRSRALR